MTTIILWMGFGLAVIDWIAVRLGCLRLEYFSKPAVMVMILIWLLGHGGLQLPLLWITAGAVFSLIGDIFLMPPQQKFLTGMAAFGLAYLCYSAGFLSYTKCFNLAFIMMFGFILLPAKETFHCLDNTLVKQNQIQFKTPFLLYATIISFMLAAALSSLTGQNVQSFPAILVSSGALLLFISDMLLVWNKFITPLPQGRLSNIITYHLGQLLVAYGVVWIL